MTTIEQVSEEETDIATPEETLTPDSVSGFYWSLNEAARRTRIAKGTISKDAARGKIQWHDRPDGIRKLLASEVLHFYGDRIKQRQQETGDTVSNTDVVTSLKQEKPSIETGQQAQILTQLAEAQAEIRLLRERLNDKEMQIADVKEDRNRWYKAYEELKLLPAPAPQPAINNNTPEPTQRRSFWDRMFGK